MPRSTFTSLSVAVCLGNTLAAKSETSVISMGGMNATVITLVAVLGIVTLGSVFVVFCLGPPSNPRGMNVERMPSGNKNKSKIIDSGEHNDLLYMDDEDQEKYLARESRAGMPSEFEKKTDSQVEVSVYSRGDNLVSVYEPPAGIMGRATRFFSASKYPTLPPRKGGKKKRVAASFMEM